MEVWAQDDKKREKVGEVEGALEKGCDARKPKKKKGKEKVEEEVEEKGEEREVEAVGVEGKENKKAKKKKKKTREEVGGGCEEGVVGGEGGSLPSVLNKRTHAKGKGEEEVDGVGGAKDKVCDGGKKKKLKAKAKAKKGKVGKEEEMR